MRLRRPCQHIETPLFPDGHYDGHVPSDYRDGTWCDGGEFLAEDALVIEKVDGEWPKPVKEVIHQWFTFGRFGEHPASDLLDALVGGS